MTKLSLLGVAAVAAFVALTAPTFAQSRATTHAATLNEPGVCPGHEAGNPYDRNTDYWAWSAWRVRGGWDDHNDLNCMPSRMNHREF